MYNVRMTLQIFTGNTAVKSAYQQKLPSRIVATSIVGKCLSEIFHLFKMWLQFGTSTKVKTNLFE